MVGAALLLVAALTALGGAYYTLQSYQDILERHVALERAVKDMNFNFKVQVQEWKNVLLRGHLTVDLNIYWAGFEASEREINVLAVMIKKSSDDKQIEFTLDQFMSEHSRLGRRYRDAKNQFAARKYSSFEADSSVRGMDRQPSLLLTRLANLVGNNAVEASAQLHKQSRWVMILTSLFLITVFVVVVKSVLTLVRRSIESEVRARTKSDFLAKMSHEIRTPMNGVLGMSELISSTDLTLLQRRYNDAVLSSANALIGIINDLLDYSKIEAGKFELEVLVYDIRQLVEEVYFVFAYTAKKKGIELLFNVNAEVPAKLNGDVNRLRQVLLNLISNAVKFTDQGSVTLGVCLNRMPSKGDYVDIEVVDTGIGMNDAACESIFEPFSQADGSINRRFGGTGLGLAISREIIQHMGGDISAHSEVGQGSCFKVSLPLSVATGVEQIPSSSLDKKRLLLVDDSEIYADIYHDWAVRWGMVVGKFIRPQSVVSHLVSSAPYDLVCLDYNMPGLNGLNLATQIRALPNCEAVPILLMTATGDLPDREELEKAGVTHAQEKPGLPERLKPIFEKMLAGENIGEKGRGLKVLQNKQSLNVLVADDNSVNCMVVKGMLLQLGHSVTVVEDGRQAVDSYQHTHVPFDLIMMDCEMPVLDGYIATQKIRRMECGDSQSKRVKIYALTAHAGAVEKERCINSGMDEVLTKPVSQRVLRQALEAQIEL